MERPSEVKYYLDIAAAVAARSTCIRRQYGAVIVKNDTIVSTGYNGTARGLINCCDLNECYREAHNIPHGQQYEKCKAVHAEANAIINASREEMCGAILFLAGFENGERMKNPTPCEMCSRMIINSGIRRVISCEDDTL